MSINSKNNELRDVIESYIENKNFEMALLMLESFIVLYPKEEYGYIRKTVVLRFLNKYKLADHFLDCIFNYMNPSSLMIKVHADTAMDLHHYSDAEERLELLRFLFPHDLYGYSKGILCAIKKCDFKKATILSIEYIDIIKSKNNLSEHTLKDIDYLIDCCILNSNFEHALTISEHLINRYPNYLNAYLKKSIVLKKIGKYDDADILLECIINLFEPSFTLLETYADTAMERSDFVTARERFALLRFLYPYEKSGYIKGAHCAYLLYYNREYHRLMFKSLFLIFDIRDAQKIQRLYLLMHSLVKDEIRISHIGRGLKNYPQFENDRKIRVCFVLNSSSQYEHIFPVYDAMKKDLRFEPFFLCFSGHLQPEPTLDFLKKIYKKEDGHHIFGSLEKQNMPLLYDLKPDVVFLQRHYMTDYPYDMHPDIMSMYTRIVYIPYGVSLSLNGKHEIYKNTSLIRSLWTFFAESKTHADIYKNMLDCRYIEVFGHPKFDLYKKYLKIDFVNEKKHILWNAHLGSLSFKKYLSVIYDIIKEDKFIFTFRPHPFTRTYLYKKKLMSTEEFDNIINNIVSCGGRYENATSGEPYIESLSNTDILISDFSTLIAEFSITTRPCIYLSDVNQDKEWLCEFSKSFIENYTYVVSNEKELRDTVFKLKNSEKDYMKHSRKLYIEKMGLIPSCCVSEKICDYIYQRIQKGE